MPIQAIKLSVRVALSLTNKLNQMKIKVILYIFIFSSVQRIYTQIISLKITPGNTNDRTLTPELCKNLYGKLYADKGYIGKKLSEKLAENDIDLVTTVRENMKAKAISIFDRAMLSKRYVI
jgi:hypothetical protein